MKFPETASFNLSAWVDVRMFSFLDGDTANDDVFCNWICDLAYINDPTMEAKAINGFLHDLYDKLFEPELDSPIPFISNILSRYFLLENILNEFFGISIERGSR